MKGAELFVRCLENEEVGTIFGLPGEENVDVMDALLDSRIEFVTTRHEQGAAFMADVHGRLTGRAGVCLSTLGPGACNLVTGVADANMDHAPVVAVSGQTASTRMHKESHQHLPLVDLFRPISKFAVSVREGEVVPEVVRKAFKVAEAEKPGVAFIELPENVAEEKVEGKRPLRVQRATAPDPAPAKVEQAAHILSEARAPIVLAGNGVVRGHASLALAGFAERLGIPVATTFMAKGAIPFSHPLALGAVGLQARDMVNVGFDRADVVVCVGYDMVEYPARLWNPSKRAKIIHIDSLPAEVDEHYVLAAGIEGDLGRSLDALAAESKPHPGGGARSLREAILEELERGASDASFPLKPQRIVSELRGALAAQDVVLSDVGAHKLWMARMYTAEAPNTCIISNGFASMGIALPGAVAAKRVHPDRRVVAVCGDAGFLMNSQEIETAIRLGLAFVVLVWRDDAYGLIAWHQERRFGRTSHVAFRNPDFVKYAESFGAKGYRVEEAAELGPILRRALADDTVAVVDCPVDYSENMKLTERLGRLHLRI